LAQVAFHLHRVRARSDRDREAPRAAAVDEVTNAGKRLEPSADELEVDLVSACLIAGWVQTDATALGDASDETILAGSDERSELLGAYVISLLGEHSDRRVRDEALGVHEHSVHVKNDAAQGGHVGISGNLGPRA